MPEGGGYLSGVKQSLAAPADGFTWTQLGAIVGFVMVMMIAWRQVIQMIMREIP